MPANFPLGQADGDLIVFNTATQIWERGTGASAGAEARAILPVSDNSQGAGAPILAYQVVQGDNLAAITVQGSNLADMASLALVDVKVGGNTGSAPTVTLITATAATIVVRLNATNATTNDYWGLLFTDDDGNVYAAPSPVRIVAGA